MNTRTELEIIHELADGQDCPCWDISDDEAIREDWVSIHVQIWSDENLEAHNG